MKWLFKPLLTCLLLGAWIAPGYALLDELRLYDLFGTEGEEWKLFSQAMDGDDKAWKTLKQSAAQGDAMAQCTLGVMYRDGYGVQRDRAQARYWFEKAAAQGVAAVQNYLGDIYYRGDLDLDGQKDYAQARNWYEKAAAQGIADAQFSLGAMYYDGEGVQQDYVQARRWYEKAAAQGNVDAQNNLGEMYRDGKGVRQDYVQARRWFEKAAETPLARWGVGREAAFNLGLMYFNGQGVRQDYAQARRRGVRRRSTTWVCCIAMVKEYSKTMHRREAGLRKPLHRGKRWRRTTWA